MHHSLQPNFFGDFQLAPSILLVFVLLLLSFKRFARSATLAERIYFYSGLFSIVLVVNTPIGVFATTYFWCHMVQHMTLMMVTGPLIVMGTVNHWRFKGKIWNLITDQWVIWFSYAAVMIGVHFTSLHKILMMNSLVHDFVEIPLYIVISYLFYYHILETKNTNRKISPGLAVLLLFFMMVPETLTGFFIYAAPNSLYEGMYTLNDQRLGGALMWSGSMIIDAVWLSFAVREWLRSEVKLAQKLDAEIANEK